MSKVLTAGNLCFDFTSFETAVKFDNETNSGLSAVDFVAETEDTLYFIEVKDYQHPKSNRRSEDLEMLREALQTKRHNFVLQMGAKIKDSLLRRYAEGYIFDKKIVYLLFINLDLFGKHERSSLKTKIEDYVPTGLNKERFSAFTEISFNVVNSERLKEHKIFVIETEV